MSHVLHWVASLPWWVAAGVLGLLPMLESSTFVGIVIPGETALVLGGVLVHADRIEFFWMVLVGSVGAIVGDSIGYAIGRRWGEKMMEKPIARRISAERWDRSRRYLAARGSAAIVFGRFAAGVRALVPMLAGTARMPYRRFLLANVTGGVAWVVTSVLAGWIAGATWERAHWLLVGIGVAMCAAWAVVLWRKGR